jgi:branched-subunit amino acid aminotransferase/4-amino-4-deoxychorismate lyase
MSFCRPRTELSPNQNLFAARLSCETWDVAELNGRPVAPSELQSLALTNYGHFTSMRVDDQRVRGLARHLGRLVQDCRALFDTDLSRDDLQRFIRHAVGDRQGSFVVRVTVFDPALDLGRPSATASPHVLLTTRPAATRPLPALRVKSVCYQRDLPRVKHTGLFGSLWHRRNAQLAGFDDALFTDAYSVISEGATWNIAFFDGERVIWPDAEVLPGVTMALLQEMHDETAVAPLSLGSIGSMQAAFATNAAIGVRPIDAIDDVTFPEGEPILELLRKQYLEIPSEPL